MTPNNEPINPVDIAVQAIAVFAAMHPRPAQINQIQAAEMLGISGPTLRKMIRAGDIKLNACGLIPIVEIDRVLAAKKR